MLIQQCVRSAALFGSSPLRSLLVATTSGSPPPPATNLVSSAIFMSTHFSSLFEGPLLGFASTAAMLAYSSSSSSQDTTTAAATAAAVVASPSSDSAVRPVVVSGPSGAGKSTLIKRVMEEFPDTFAVSVSHTTRAPREGETPGVHYHYTDMETMKAAVARGEFIESAIFGKNMYGTSKKAVQDVASAGRVCILDIERQGCESIRAAPDLDPLYIFVRPPSMAELERRLLARGSETTESLKARMDEAADAFEYGETPGKFNHVIFNEHVDTAYNEFRLALRPLIEAAAMAQQQQQAAARAAAAAAAECS